MPSLATVAALLAPAALAPRPAAACGGLFCNSSQNLAVNQAAERIIFANNGDGTVTAVIEIMYEGQADEFAWLLPIPGEPEIGVSSKQVFDQLQRLTDPTYTLQTQVEGVCMQQGFPNGGQFAAGAGTGASAPMQSAPDGGEPPVSVVASGVVGPYDYHVISLTQGLEDPAEVAIEWLTDNGYDVGAVGPEVLRPYLEEGLNLLAFRLTKGNVTGSIRPVRLTYEAELPMIPIRPTAVAANDNMGVMVFMLAEGRAIPRNYKALELNEALIDWFNPQRNYNDVVNRAADEAGGQGFVTEFAGDTMFLQQQIFGTTQRQQWNEFQAGSYPDALAMLRDAFNRYGSWDGFDVALRQSVTPDDPELIQTAINCPNCPMAETVELSPAAFIESLYVNVIEPVLETHDLLTGRPNLTRLYTTMSADEMTVDPIFDDNNDLPAISNQHTATQIIECSPQVLQQDAPWRIELASGDVIRGRGSARSWPIAIDDQPANARIMQLTTRGEGEVVEDNRGAITEQLIAMARDFSVGDPNGADPNPLGTGDAGGSSGSGGRGGPAGDEGDGNGMAMGKSGGLCSAAPGAGPAGALPFVALAALLLAVRRRRA